VNLPPRASAVLQIDGWTAINFPYDAHLVSCLKDYVPASERRYDPPSKTWFVTMAWSTTAIGLVRRIYPDVEVIDQRNWWDDRDDKPPLRDRARGSDPYAALHLLPSAPPELIESAYRTLAMLCHPDRGGDTPTMQAINGAYERLKARLAS
jgi:DnaJ domain